MAKIWTEPYDATRHQNRMWEVDGATAPSSRADARTLLPRAVHFVRVCSFTFEFHSLEQIRVCLAYYERKLQATSRLPVESGDYGGDQSETQRWFERLPLYLREEPKRRQVVKALRAAMVHVGTRQA